MMQGVRFFVEHPQIRGKSIAPVRLSGLYQPGDAAFDYFLAEDQLTGVASTQR